MGSEKVISEAESEILEIIRKYQVNEHLGSVTEDKKLIGIDTSYVPQENYDELAEAISAWNYFRFYKTLSEIYKKKTGVG